MHQEKHPLAGQTVKLKDNIKTTNGDLAGQEYRIEDWWDRVFGSSWMFAEGNPAALIYAMRSGTKGLPINDEVVYGKVGAFGHLIHVSELDVSEDASATVG